MSWEIRKFGDVVEFPPKVKLQKKEQYSFIPMDEVEAGRKYVRPQYLKEWKGSGGSRFEEGDTLFARITPCLQNGKVAQAKELINGQGFGSTEFFIFRGIEGVTDTNFVYYLSINSEFTDYAIGSMVGASGRQRADAKFVGEYEFNLPPLQTQKRIADILSAYDDLIENNLKRIKLLEQAAQNIYKEWFVNLRFPGHENTAIDEGSGLPLGWEEKGLCEFNSFKQYKAKIKVYEGEKEYLATANVDGIKISERGEYFSFDKKPSRAQIAPPSNSVWFARMSNTDKVLCFTEGTDNDLIISSGFAGFKAEEKVFLPFLFCTINNDFFSNLKDIYSTGSTQVSINNKSINSIRFIEPEVQKIKEFGEKLYPSLEMINKLFVTNKKLKAARDILLPRLMNRTIEV